MSIKSSSQMDHQLDSTPRSPSRRISRRVSRIARLILQPKDKSVAESANRQTNNSSDDVEQNQPSKSDHTSFPDKPATGMDTQRGPSPNNRDRNNVTGDSSAGRSRKSKKTKSDTVPMKIGEPKLQSGSLMIGEKSILEHTSSFRRPNYPPPNRPKRPGVLGASPPNEAHIAVAYLESTKEEAETATNDTGLFEKSANKGGEQKKAKERPDRRYDNAPHRNSSATLSGLQEKFDEIRAKCRDPERPLPPTPRITPPPDLLDDEGMRFPKADTKSSSLYDTSLTSSTMLISPHEKSGSPDLVDGAPLKSIASKTYSFDSSDVDQFIFEDYSNVNIKPIPYEDRHKSVKPANSDPEEVDYTKSFIRRAPSIRSPHVISDHDPDIEKPFYRAISIWRPGQLVSRALRGTESEPEASSANVENQASKSSHQERDTEWDTLRMDSPIESKPYDFGIKRLATQHTHENAGRISGLPRLLPVCNEPQ